MWWNSVKLEVGKSYVSWENIWHPCNEKKLGIEKWHVLSVLEIITWSVAKILVNWNEMYMSKIVLEKYWNLEESKDS
jgi:hypothetical protein